MSRMEPRRHGARQACSASPTAYDPHAMDPAVASAYPALPPPRAIALTTLPERLCPYLPDRLAQTRAFVARSMDPQVYHELMDAGFRRSGELFYQPICRGCRACTPIRVPTEHFRPNK